MCLSMCLLKTTENLIKPTDVFSECFSNAKCIGIVKVLDNAIDKKTMCTYMRKGKNKTSFRLSVENQESETKQNYQN